jgi:hypothetical protein
VIAVAGVATPLAIQHKSQARLREENESLRQQASKVDQLAAENERLSNLVVQAKGAELLSRQQMSELLRLRGEVTHLRAERMEMLSSARTGPAKIVTGGSVADIPAGRINFINADLSQVLSIYGALANAELLVEQGVRLPPALITLSNRQDLTRTEALRLFEETLREQYGLVVEHPDAKHFTVRPSGSVPK